jgi:DNA-directed RNA polymerase subunit M/transcription elongation factor TFIIS
MIDIKGGRLIYCQECGKLVLINDKAPQKFCKKCAKEIEKEQDKLRKRKYREK